MDKCGNAWNGGGAIFTKGFTSPRLRITASTHYCIFALPRLRMKIYYITPYNLQYTQTSQKNDITLCEGFAENGCDVELIFPFYKTDHPLDLAYHEIFSGYGIQTPFRLKVVKSSLINRDYPLIKSSFLSLYIFFYGLSLIQENRKRLDEIYFISRSSFSLLPLLVLKKLLALEDGPKIIAWAHEVKKDWKYQWLYKNCDGIIGTNSAITGDIAALYKIDRDKLEISLNPITDYQRKNIISREEARRDLNLSNGKPIIAYTGKLYTNQREIKYILEAARQLPEYRFIFTGGRDNVVHHYRDYCRSNGIGNATFTGFISRYIDVRRYQFAADALISYYTTQDHATRYNLPNKMCEYMLARNVIVTPDYLATRDVLDESNAFFVEPEDPEALAEGLQEIIEDRDRAKALADNAFQRVQELTYKKRAKVLVDFFKSL